MKYLNTLIDIRKDLDANNLARRAKRLPVKSMSIDDFSFLFFYHDQMFEEILYVKRLLFELSQLMAK